MQLSPQDTERFYRIWWPLLHYVNAERRIVPELLTTPEKATLSGQEARPIRDVLWKYDELREAFIAKNPASLSAADLAMVASWDNRIQGKFFIFRYLSKHTVFLAHTELPQAYGVLGLMSPVQAVISQPLPILIDAVLLPFENKIIYDGMLVPYSVIFGSGIRNSLNEAYRTVQERGGVTTTLQPCRTRETQQAISSGNRKILAAFRKDLAALKTPVTVTQAATPKPKRPPSPPNNSHAALLKVIAGLTLMLADLSSQPSSESKSNFNKRQ
jgi:hypothetical protein